MDYLTKLKFQNMKHEAELNAIMQRQEERKKIRLYRLIIAIVGAFALAIFVGGSKTMEIIWGVLFLWFICWVIKMMSKPCGSERWKKRR